MLADWQMELGLSPVPLEYNDLLIWHYRWFFSAKYLHNLILSKGKVKALLSDLFCTKEKKGPLNTRHHFSALHREQAVKWFVIVLKCVWAMVKVADTEKSLQKTMASIGHKCDRDSVSLESKWAGAASNCQMANPVCADSCTCLAKRRQWLLVYISSKLKCLDWTVKCWYVHRRESHPTPKAFWWSRRRSNSIY